MHKVIWTAVLVSLSVLAISCEPDGNDAGSGTGTVTATPPVAALVPPFEGGPLPTAEAGERTNFRESPGWQLPEPEELPTPPANLEGAQYHPPETPECPEGWAVYQRPREGFRFCYPDGWAPGGEGYVTAAGADRWWASGLFFYEDGVQAAHVGIYAVNNYAPPLTYTRDCGERYAVTLAGQPAVVCGSVPGVFPEARIIVYHVRTEQFDYFVTVAPYLQYDAQTASYGDSSDPEMEALAIQVAQTFQTTQPLSP